MFGGFTVDERCEKSPRIAPRAQTSQHAISKWEMAEPFRQWRMDYGQTLYK